ncbi:hypothetical protein TRFO_28945 [Tritrichomonas foetus]|uniref:sn-1-specific diacylglycerol lipase n=1 Tax=Tritrichomonas foetus TaxID=1144522 RepID=A0A1J4JWV0_9EUKA|nr:hypothetical protein TRFO_28945 [Tritrichomonas foetus]|eukprot:OHT03623.1 hypothetical protein TRFO_28945 [Tritrichomonas foetus]
MVRLVGGVLIALLQLCVRLANAAYYADFSSFGGDVLYSHTVCEQERPVFFVYTQDGALFIVTRGSSEPEDFATDAEFTETHTDYGIFHTGFYNAACYVYNETIQYIVDWSGPVYFVGHSYGASVSQILSVIIHHFHPNVDAYSFAYAPMPAMNLAADDTIQDRMYGIVNDDDIIPTLSIPNCYQRFTILYPTIHNVPTDVLVDSFDTLLKILKFTTLIDEEMFEMIWNAVPTIVVAAKEYEAGTMKYVRYPAGTVYQLKKNNPKTLAAAIVNPEIALSTLSIALNALSDHDCDKYIVIVDQILEA